MDDITFILLVVAMLNIILFFKIWGMTNNVKRIMSFYMYKNGIKIKVDNLKGESFIDKDGKDIKII